MNDGVGGGYGHYSVNVNNKDLGLLPANCSAIVQAVLRPPRVENKCAVALSTRLRKNHFATGALAGTDLERALTSEGGSSWPRALAKRRR